jgi:hypothetical protein
VVFHAETSDKGLVANNIKLDSKAKATSKMKIKRSSHLKIKTVTTVSVFSLICKTNKHFKKDNSLSNKQKCKETNRSLNDFFSTRGVLDIFF